MEIALWDRVHGHLRQRHRLGLAEFEGLYALDAAADENLRVGALARALGITMGGASKLVDRLVAGGLVTRVTDADDRRAARLALTPTGRRRVRAAGRTYEDTVATLLDGTLSTDEQLAMHGYVTRLLAALDQEEPT